ncbi:hypothetical protein CERZMDRAFT_89738 [Cercospora zeae-maydis SCOH1-5]|uniref:Secreted peptide n=1 Tax=Cercospora zeae-maydis SCOH1-5 TaxID=717836 RepID=A0A6A6FUQ3_9PEZI|nr:hypothetical protein CERZMDRAFT_89738 [Cercospora zeae-maydis SCOH1-5]
MVLLLLLLLLLLPLLPPAILCHDRRMVLSSFLCLWNLRYSLLPFLLNVTLFTAAPTLPVFPISTGFSGNERGRRCVIAGINLSMLLL